MVADGPADEIVQRNRYAQKVCGAVPESKVIAKFDSLVETMHAVCLGRNYCFVSYLSNFSTQGTAERLTMPLQ